MTGLAMIVLLDPKQDAAALHHLWQSAYRQEADLLGVTDFPPLKVSREELQTSPAQWFGVWQGGAQLLAACAVEAQNDHHLISAMLVAPQAQRQGHGRRLLTHVCERHHAKRLRVGTAQANRPALALYAQAGFVAVKQQQLPLQQGWLDYLVLEKAAQTM
ncbi:GNAT family N-acetyltransferase [Massilia sp. W12]|uniref:GNAT family N-acetyltransferase n=1 Tax=Massilia sp. W12 TaxID=3126507 RepID=UPI0030D61802